MDFQRIFGASIGSSSLDLLKWLKRNKCTPQKGPMYLSRLEKFSIEALELSLWELPSSVALIGWSGF